jgi:hypothetical protein
VAIYNVAAVANEQFRRFARDTKYKTEAQVRRAYCQGVTTR